MDEYTATTTITGHAYLPMSSEVVLIATLRTALAIANAVLNNITPVGPCSYIYPVLHKKILTKVTLVIG